MEFFMKKLRILLYGWDSCPTLATRSAIPWTVAALFFLFTKYYSNPFLSYLYNWTIDTKSHALSIASPAPCARLGAVALAASPRIITLRCWDSHENEVMSFTLQISVRRIVSAGVSWISYLMFIGACQDLNCVIIQSFC